MATRKPGTVDPNDLADEAARRAVRGVVRTGNMLSDPPTLRRQLAATQAELERTRATVAQAGPTPRSTERIAVLERRIAHLKQALGEG